MCVTCLSHVCNTTHLYVCGVTRPCGRYDSSMCVPWLILYVWHDSSICGTWRAPICEMTHSFMSHYSFIYVTWLIHICDMTHSYATWLIHMCDTMWPLYIREMNHSHLSRVCVAWFIQKKIILMHICDMTYLHDVTTLFSWNNAFTSISVTCMYDTNRSYVWHGYLHVWHDSFIFVTWFFHTRDMTDSYTWHDSVYMERHTSRVKFMCVTCDILICVTWLNVTRKPSFWNLIWLIHIWQLDTRDMTHLYT